jgi:bifunctional non-homologous end joining protein LigD
MVVKRRDSPYEPGRRSSAWVKVKHVRHDALVVGAIRPATGSHPLSGIVVGWPRDDGRLDYAGVVEVGFAPDERSLVMSSLERCAAMPARSSDRPSSVTWCGWSPHSSWRFVPWPRRRASGYESPCSQG